MAKSADAFRTISEVAEWLGSPAHVLRFWESKFSQVKPVKRAGGRRYYRPADMLLLGGIKKLLHDDGMTIKGVQKILREQGVKHVSALSPPLDLTADDAPDAPGLVDVTPAEPTPTGTTDEATSESTAESTVVQFQRDAIEDAEEAEAEAAPEAPAEETEADAAPGFAFDAPEAGEDEAESEPRTTFATEPEPEAEAEPAVEPEYAQGAHEEEAAEAPAFATSAEPSDLDTLEESAEAEEDAGEAMPGAFGSAEVPAFLHGASAQSEPEPEAAPEPEDTGPRPAKVNVPADPLDSEIVAPPGLLRRIAERGGKRLAGNTRIEAAELRDKLAAHYARQTGAAD